MAKPTKAPLWMLALAGLAAAAFGYWIVSAAWDMPWAPG